jgi:hypothetical protein
MAKRCIGQLRYLARSSAPAAAGDD